MEIDLKLINWLEEQMNKVDHGEVGLFIHFKNNKVCWVEKLKRVIEKPKIDRNSIHKYQGNYQI